MTLLYFVSIIWLTISYIRLSKAILQKIKKKKTIPYHKVIIPDIKNYNITSITCFFFFFDRKKVFSEE